MTDHTKVASAMPTPRFTRVAQSHPFDCWAACISMIVKKSVAEVNDLATRTKILPFGPYWITDETIAKVLIQYGWVSTLYKPTAGITDDLPDLAIVMLGYDEQTQLGHHALAYRQRGLPSQQNKVILTDPAPWKHPREHVRVLRDGDDFSWFIAVKEVAQSDY